MTTLPFRFPCHKPLTPREADVLADILREPVPAAVPPRVARRIIQMAARARRMHRRFGAKPDTQRAAWRVLGAALGPECLEPSQSPPISLCDPGTGYRWGSGRVSRTRIPVTVVSTRNASRAEETDSVSDDAGVDTHTRPSRTRQRPSNTTVPQHRNASGVVVGGCRMLVLRARGPPL